MIVLPFNLDLAVKYPNNIYTKKGERVSIVSFNSTKEWGKEYPIQVIIDKVEYNYTLEGYLSTYFKDDDKDLEIRLEQVISNLSPDLGLGDKICICGIDYIIVGEFFDGGEEYFVVRETAIRKYILLHKNTELSTFELIY